MSKLLSANMFEVLFQNDQLRNNMQQGLVLTDFEGIVCSYQYMIDSVYPVQLCSSMRSHSKYCHCGSFKSVFNGYWVLIEQLSKLIVNCASFECAVLSTYRRTAAVY